MIFNKHLLMNTFEPGTDGGGAPPAETPPAANDFKWPENWKEKLPEEFKAEKSLETIGDIPSLVKSYIHAQKLVGANKAVVPDPKLATPEDWRSFFQKAGLPTKPEEYKVDVKDPETLPENFLDVYKNKAYELNILPHQAQQLLEWYREFETGYAQKLQEQHQEQLKNSLDGYRQIVGQAYERKLAYANKVVDEFGGPELSKLLVDLGLNKNPEIIKMFSSLGEKLFGEDKIIGESRDKMSALSPEEAESKWNDIRADKGHPYWNASHPNHKLAVQEVSKLMNFMHGG